MNKKNLVLMSLNIMESMDNNSYLSSEITLDSDINDCLIKMYFYMMSGDYKYYDDFIKIYNNLNDKQKEYVKNDYINIINAQDEGKKIKKKGEMKL